MGYKDFYEDDPWPDKCPDPSDLSSKQLLAIISCWPHAELSPWEQDFCSALERRLKGDQSPTEKQLQVLQKRNLFVRLYDSDPACWENL